MNDEGLVLELFEELLELGPLERRAKLEARIKGLADADWLRERVVRLFGLEADLGEVFPEGVGSDFRGILSDLEGIARPAPLPVGTRLGEFEILGVLGVGGSSRVYLAAQASPAREVALKVLEGEGGSNEQLAERLKGEADLIGGLVHPSIATVFAAGVSQTSEGAAAYPWLAMELVPGARDVGAFLEDAPVTRVLKMMIEVLGAVEFGHRRGIVHGDLKPANLLVDESGHVRVIDYGVAAVHRELGATAEGSGQEPSRGTLAYMAPELFEEPKGSPSADIFAVGATLFELLLKRPARDLAGCDLCEAIRKASSEAIQVPKREGLSRQLVKVLRRALAERPERRYGSAAEFAADLEAILGGRLVARATFGSGWRGHAVRAGMLVRRHPVMGLALLALIGFGRALHNVPIWATSDEAASGQQGTVDQVEAFRENLESTLTFAQSAEEEPGSGPTKRRILDRGLEQLLSTRVEATALGQMGLLILAQALLKYGGLLALGNVGTPADLESAARAFDAAMGCLDEAAGMDVTGPDGVGITQLRLELLAANAGLQKSWGDGAAALATLVDWDLVAQSLLGNVDLAEADRFDLGISQVRMAQLRARIDMDGLQYEKALRDFGRARSQAGELLQEPGAQPHATDLRLMICASIRGMAAVHLHFNQLDECLEELAEGLDLVDVELEVRSDDKVFASERWRLQLVEFEALRLSGDFVSADRLLETLRRDAPVLAEGDSDSIDVSVRAALLDSHEGQLRLDQAEVLWPQQPEKADALRKAGAAAYGHAIETLKALETDGFLAAPLRQDLDRYEQALKNCGLSGPAPLRD